ncbi:hypothetical protein ZIOFF_005637 [Zingiber officinale]|uniref:Flap endonuclease 1 n=1 Tax=Zingiber officinale TaxID=94328 RepID=A0A8J5IB34_ZINOF|nr:hypothetical protein ZIOFF_005637 [Zingiber officinale]
MRGVSIPMPKLFIMFSSFSMVSLALPGMSDFIARLFFPILPFPFPFPFPSPSPLSPLRDLHPSLSVEVAMGIKGLTKLLADHAPKAMKEQKFESYFGRKIAIDASMSIYQFLVRDVQSNYQIIRSRYVFDGQPPELKKEELAKRQVFTDLSLYSKREDATKDLSTAIETGDLEGIEKYSKRTVKVTKQHNEDCKRLLRLMGVPTIELTHLYDLKAPCEAEAQCAALCKSDKVYAVASEDMDSLTFGAPKFLRHLMDPSSKKIPVMEFEVSKVLEELELTMDQFIDLCILSGCDYCDSIKVEYGVSAATVPCLYCSSMSMLLGLDIAFNMSIGGQTALKLIRQHNCIENILENINKERYQIPEEWPYQEARRLFKEPNVIMDVPELKWIPPDEEGIQNFLVNENGFNSDRVAKAIEKIKSAKNKSSQGRLESFFKPVINASAPTKRKESDKASKETSTNKNSKAGTAKKKR